MARAVVLRTRVEKSAATFLLESKIGEPFDSIFTGASSKGTWVRFLSLAVEGKLVLGFDGEDVGDRMRVQLFESMLNGDISISSR